MTLNDSTLTTPSSPEQLRTRDRATLYRANEPAFADWATGSDVLARDERTQVLVHDMVDVLHRRGQIKDKIEAYRLLGAADRIAQAAMWLVVHMTYARTVRINGTPLEAGDFKTSPDGHTGGSLNMVPAYVGYLLANALGGVTRSWLMGQGHCVSAIDAVNLIVDNMSSEQTERYSFSGCCHVNSPSLEVGMPFVDQVACAADFHASNASSRW